MNEQGWIEWNGGEPPVPDDAAVEAKDRWGDLYHESAGNLDWEHRDGSGDIIAYRIVEPGK